jgi:nitrite reductase/ring-hydroxylating ferredoxin subunit
MMRYMAVLALGALPPGEQKQVTLEGGAAVLLIHGPDGIHALQPLCPHARLPLVGGKIVGGHFLCPHHGARFDLTSGMPVRPIPVAAPLVIYPVRIENEQIFVAVDDNDKPKGRSC